MAKRLVFTGLKQVKLEEYDLQKLGENDVHIKTKYSLMSTGTETIVFSRLFAEGTHWDDWVKYPFYPGYAAIGEIVAVGKNVSTLKPGQLVAHRGGHASEHILNQSEVFVVPDGLDSKEAVWFALAKITFMGAKAADYFLGDRVMIVGAGPIGQCSIRWAKTAGASDIICVDMMKDRLDMAKVGGATAVFDQKLSDDLKDDVMAVLNGSLPDIVIDTTGNAMVFSECLKFAKRQGKVVVMGDTGTPSNQHLSPDVVLHGLTIVGAHDGLSGGNWPETRIFNLFFTMLKNGTFNMKGINTHEFKPEQCVEAYKTATEKRGETMGIIFNWN